MKKIIEKHKEPNGDLVTKITIKNSDNEVEGKVILYIAIGLILLFLVPVGINYLSSALQSLGFTLRRNGDTYIYYGLFIIVIIACLFWIFSSEKD